MKITFLGAFANHGMNATGTLPGSIFAGLAELNYFGMVGNPKLSGSIPAGWAAITKMQKLLLYSNPV